MKRNKTKKKPVINAKKVPGGSQGQFQAIFDAAPDGIILANAKTKKFYMGNNAICRMLGYSRAKIKNLGVKDIHPKESLDNVFDQFEKLAKGQIHVARELPVKRRDGTIFYADITAAKILVGGKRYLMGFFHDVTKRRKAEEALRLSEHKIRAIFDQTFQFIGMLTPDGILIEANRAALEFEGVRREDWINKPFWQTPWWTHSADMQKKLRAAIKKAAGGEIVVFEATHKAPDGSLHYIDFSLKPVKDETGKVIFLLPEGRDITERKRLEEEAKVVARLKESAEIKSNFTSMVSHELRSPLAVIKEGLNIVLEGLVGGMTDEQKDILTTAKRNTDRLGRLINNVLDFQKIDSGKMELNVRQADLNDAVMEACKEISILAKEKGLDFIVNFDEDKLITKFDRDRIVQVVTNLLGNAIKFTDKGSVSISVKREDGFAHVIVQDTGYGIKTEEIPRLFKFFEQLEPGSGKKKSGTGLGLAISKEIVFAHNGTIWAESKPGKGSVFHFTLPLK